MGIEREQVVEKIYIREHRPVVRWIGGRRLLEQAAGKSEGSCGAKAHVTAAGYGGRGP